jgi:hypothetical protein
VEVVDSADNAASQSRSVCVDGARDGAHAGPDGCSAGLPRPRWVPRTGLRARASGPMSSRGCWTAVDQWPMRICPSRRMVT